MQVGDRVARKGSGGVPANEFRGRIVGWHDERGFEVRWSSEDTAYYKERHLVIVETVVMEGEQRWDERLCKWYIGDTSIDDYLDNNGDAVRLTIERVKK